MPINRRKIAGASTICCRLTTMADEIQAIDPEPQFGVDRSTEPGWPRIDLAPQVPCSIKLGVIALGLGRPDRRLRLGHHGRWRARRLIQPIRWAPDQLLGAGAAPSLF